MKICSHCKETLPKTDFSITRRNKDELDCYCKACRKAINDDNLKKNYSLVSSKVCSVCLKLLSSDMFHKNKGKVKGIEDSCKICRNTRIVERRYDLKKGELDQMKKNNQYKCSICKKLLPLSVDHCHVTNKIRGLLCNNCNNGLGRFEDNINYLKKAIKYLKGDNNE